MKEMSEIKLDVCPLCSGELILSPVSGCSGYIFCADCGMKTAKFWDEPLGMPDVCTKWYEIAAKLWNRRTPPAAHWDKSNGVPRCTYCSYLSRDYFDLTPEYCPKCGRKMVEEESK